MCTPLPTPTMETRFKKMIQGAVRHKCQNVSSALKKQSMKEDILPPTYAARPGLGAGWGRRRLTARPHLEQLSSGHGVPVELPPEAAQPRKGPLLWMLLLPRLAGWPHNALDGGDRGGCFVHLRVFCRRLLPSPADFLFRHGFFLTLNKGREGFSCRN